MGSEEGVSRLIERSYAVILAGVRAERFWPLSTGAGPKAFQRLIDSRSLLQATAQRAYLLLPWERIGEPVGHDPGRLLMG